MGSVVPSYPTYVVIPFKDEPDLTCHVLDLVYQEGVVDHILLYDNGSSPETVEQLNQHLEALDVSRGGKHVHYFDTPDLGIYQMWNAGWQFAMDNENRGPSNLVFLNNDIDFIPGLIKRMVFMLRRMEDALIIYPDYDRPVSKRVAKGFSPRLTHGTKKDGGMCGHCFVTRTEAAKKGLPMFDEQFEWWCGDDDFARNVANYPASQYRLVGWPCDHLNEATASNGDNDWTHGAKGRDVERYIAKWGSW